ncbi:MAG: hypothetical protein IPN68_10360 [Bacteroidetes bacterium]|nr:hypothetical protein [Bacteroidota bacterium]
MRKIIYTTNAIESLTGYIRKHKNQNSLPR